MKRNLKELMREKKVTMRDLSEETGLSSALICYIAQGYARFPEAWQLNATCERLGCKPTDLYTRTELHRYYPNVFPSVRKPSEENPRVRIGKEKAAIIRQTYGDLTEYVNKAVLRQIRLDLMEEEGHYI